MSADKKTCVKCGVEFFLMPDKPGYANVCPDCSDPEKKPSLHELKSDVREIVAELARGLGKSDSEVQDIISGEHYEDWANQIFEQHKRKNA